ncbi:MAG: MFS transporter [Candidatus Rokubacteria bacterium]|nr:MFS transporter [Candidatus Rokubacteria bacterium]
MSAEPLRQKVVLAGVMLAIFLAAMESTVVATAMPTVIASLGGIRIYSWVFSAFLLTSTITMPLWGRLSDLFGRRPTYLAGVAIFLLGSGLSGLSQSMTQLIVFRALQGLGAGSLITIGMTLVGDLFALEQRAKKQGYISGVWGVASLVGPAIGGFLADYVSWRWVFYINLPFGALSALAIAWGLSEPVARRRAVSIDLLGTGLFAVAISSLLGGLVEGGRAASWLTPSVLGPLGLAALFLVLFVAVERRVAEPLIPLELFKNPMVRAGAVTGFLSGMAMFGAISFIPLYLQAVVGATATEAGFVLTPFVLGWVCFSILSARLVLRVGYRGVVVTGMASLTLSFLLLSEWGQGLTRLGAVRDVVFAGFGMGMVMVPMLIAVQSAVPKRDLGIATSTVQFFRTIGGAVGVAVMGAAMAHRLQGELLALLAASGQGTRLAAQVQELVAQPDLIVNPHIRETLAPALLAHIRLALAHALHGVFVVGLIVCLLALASAFLVPSGRARDLARAEEAAPTPGS